jgi:site-specific recombinase XerD
MGVGEGRSRTLSTRSCRSLIWRCRRVRSTARHSRSSRTSSATRRSRARASPASSRSAGITRRRRRGNRHVATVRSFARYGARTGLLEIDGDIDLLRRTEKHDHTRSIPHASLERLWERRDIALRERTLWRLLYETARADEVLRLKSRTSTSPPSARGHALRAATSTGCSSGLAARGYCHA